MGKNHGKQPLAAASPPGGKTPLALPGDDWRQRHPIWRIRLMDLDHEEWGWCRASPDDLRKVHERLAEYERKTWKEILAMRGGKGPYNGLIEIATIDARNKQAGDRIRQFREVEAAGSLMKLRVDSARRVWGVMELNACSLFWCDPKHTVWQSDD
jgi:hypothetical protein